MNNITALIIAAATAFIVTRALGYAVIPWLNKLNFGSIITGGDCGRLREKRGVPTMGGVLIAAGVLSAVGVIIVTDKIMGGDITAAGSLLPSEARSKLYSGLLAAAAFGLLGFASDYAKAVMKTSSGIAPRQKKITQLMVCLAYTASLYLSMGRTPYTYIPFAGNIELGWFFWFFCVCVVYASVNAVNATAGADGISAEAAFTASAALTAIAVIKGFYGAGIVSVSIAGSCIGFLMWSKAPPKVLMGETGTMFLGGMIVAVSFALNCPLILLFVGAAFLIEGISVILRETHYLLTNGKKPFITAPIHLYFKKAGRSENKTAVLFTLINIIGCAAGILIIYIDKH